MRYIFFIALFFNFFIFPQSIFAHNPGYPPFIKVSDRYVRSSPYFQGVYSQLYIPEEITDGLYTINHPIQFAIDMDRFPISGDLQFRWYFAQGDNFSEIVSPIQEGSSATFTFPDKKSYLVILQIKTPTDTDYTTFDMIQVNTISNTSYAIPQPAISIAAKELQTGSPITFHAKAQLDQSAKIAKYLWDFGDGKIREGEIATYSFKQKGFMSAVYVRAIDNKGYSNDVGLSVRGDNGFISFENFPSAQKNIFDLKTSDQRQLQSPRTKIYITLASLSFLLLVVIIFVSIHKKRKKYKYIKHN